MPDVSARGDADRRPVIYAGRFLDQVMGPDLPNECVVLGEQDALSYKLARVLNHANVFVLLDLLSFPPESMTEEHGDVPIVVVLPSGSDAESLIATFGSTLFEGLEFFDHLVTSDSALWEELRRKYCWAKNQRIPIISNEPGEVATAVCALFKAEPTPATTPGAGQHEAARYWHERNYKLATSVAHQAVQSINNDPRLNKALHRAQAAVLRPQFAAPWGRRDTKVPLDVLEVGTGVGRWTSNFDLTKTRFVGIDVCEDLVRDARANFPDQRFDRLGSDLLFPYDDESFDLVFSVTVMHRNPAPAKRTLLSEMWRVVRPGGRLLFLENFVFTKQLEKPTVYPISVTGFVDLIHDAMTGQVVLEHVESLRYPDEDLHRGGLISLLKLGVPKTR